MQQRYALFQERLSVARAGRGRGCIAAFLTLVAGKSFISAGQLLNLFFVLTIITSLVGLFGLSLFIAERNRRVVSIRKVFLYNAGYLVLKGLFWGNLIGLSILLAQKYIGFITLNPETYYVSEAPVFIDFWFILLLNFFLIQKFL